MLIAQEMTQAQRVGKEPIRIVVADDHPIVRDALRRLVESDEEFKVVGVAKDGVEALELVNQHHPDILLLDKQMPNVDGLEVLKRLRLQQSKTRVILFTASGTKEDYVEAMKFGCCGVILKDAEPDFVLRGIVAVHRGEICLDKNTIAAVMRQFAANSQYPDQRPSQERRSPLTAREKEVITLVAQGYKNKEMAEKMFISEQTVKNHLHNIFDKLGVKDRLELALYAIHKGLYREEGGE